MPKYQSIDETNPHFTASTAAQALPNIWSQLLKLNENTTPCLHVRTSFSSEAQFLKVCGVRHLQTFAVSSLFGCRVNGPLVNKGRLQFPLPP